MTKSSGQKGFTLIEGLLIIIALSLIVGVGYYVYSANKDTDKNSTSSQTQSKTQSKPIDNKRQYLEVKELGIKMLVTDATSDAYYYFNNGIPYLSVHYFDNLKGFEGCTAAGRDGTGGGLAAIAHAKAGDDYFGSPLTKQELIDRGAVNIGDTYYWVEPNSQTSCYNQNTVAQDNPNVGKVSEYKKAFTGQQNTITKI